MKTTFLSLVNGTLLYSANGYCKSLYPSFTVVHVSSGDLAGAWTSNAARVASGDGLFTIKDARKLPASAIIESDVIPSIFPFNSLLLSANADLPSTSSIALEAKALIKQEGSSKTGWTQWYRLGKYNTARTAASAAEQEDENAKVEIDLLSLKRPAYAFKYRVTLYADSSALPVLRLVAASYSDTTAAYDKDAALSSLEVMYDKKKVKQLPWVKELPVPQYSQTTQQKRYASDICSPTTITMLMEYFGVKTNIIDNAKNVFDNQAEIYGNWIFNTFYVGSKGLDSFLVRVNSAEEAEFEVAHGRPLAASITYGVNELSNAPIKKTKGHLTVIKGFDRKGNFIVNDPAAPNEKTVTRVYDRKEYAGAWLKNKHGLAYKISPRYPKYMQCAVPATWVKKTPDAEDMETQLLLGENVKVLEVKNGWAKVECLEQGYYMQGKEPPDGAWDAYPGWVKMEDLTWGEDYGYDYTVDAASAPVTLLTGTGQKPVTVYTGTRLLAIDRPKDGKIKLLFPGGKAGYAAQDALRPAADRMREGKIRDAAIALAEKFTGTKYVWGGRTAQGIDCSGLVGAAYRASGIDLPRNAMDQYYFAKHITPNRMKKGDLIFLTSHTGADRIAHVMLYDGEGYIIEAEREHGSVRKMTFEERFGKQIDDTKNGEKINGQKIYFATPFVD